MNLIGLIIAVGTFFIIGVFHPLVIKAEYYFSKRCWWVFLLLGLGFISWSIFCENMIAAVFLGIIGTSCLWSILELFEQEKRVEQGRFPKNPKRKHKS